MTLNSDAKFELTLTLWFQNWYEGEISLKHSKTWKFVLWWALFVQSVNVLARKFQRNYLLWHGKGMQNLSENWLVVWKMTRNLVNFHASSWNSENLHLIGSFCQKYKKVKKKKYLSWHWRVMKSLKKNWLFVSKMTWRIW